MAQAGDAVAQRLVDIVVPVRNEEGSVDAFYRRMQALGLSSALIFVDNASTDGTVARIQTYPDVRLIQHARDEGYGASVRDGSVASDAEHVVIIDADLEYPPERIPALLEALREHPVVYCSRFRGPHPPPMPVFRRIGNALASRLYNLLFRQSTTDLYTGMKGFRRAALPVHELQKGGFEHGAEIAALIWLRGHRIWDLPVDYTPRQQGVSKMRHLPESLKLLGYVVAYWVRCVVLRRPLNPSR
jgi:glycosyltransferase involved in cell wall biosynthesis